MKRRLVFTANDRPYYLQPVIDQWQQVRGFGDWAPTVFLEPGPVADVMADIAEQAGVAVVRNHTKYGVLRNPWHAIDTAMADADFVVLAEDDVLVSDDILDYFTWAAQTFADEHVLAVCASTFAKHCPPERVNHVQRGNHFTPLIWGTWRRRWADVLRDTWDHDYSSGTPEAPQSGWDWNINLRIMGDWSIVSPMASRSTHIGLRHGTHTTMFSFPGSIAATFQPHRPAAAFIATDGPI